MITFKATGLRNRMWEISENQPADKQTIGKCANVNYGGESDIGGSIGEIREHKHRRR